MKFDLERLNTIPILRVLEALGATKTHLNRGKVISCPNKSEHSNLDNNPSMSVQEKHNICKCFACGLAGKPVTIATKMLGDFKKGCEFLHSYFSIPFLDDNSTYKRDYIQTYIAYSEPKINYILFDNQREYKEIGKLAPFMSNYRSYSKEARLKLIYTTIYRFSLDTNQSKKIDYYKSRGIENQKNLEKIGFIGDFNDISNLERLLIKYFSINDLIEFKIFHKEKRGWNYQANMVVVPLFDLYSNMVTGFNLRNTMDNSKVKELNVFCSNIITPMPFGLTNEALKSKTSFWITEGHIDSLSCMEQNKNEKIGFIGISGVYVIKLEHLGLFKNKSVVLSFDKDDAGKKGMNRLIPYLKELGIPIYTAVWKSDHKDLNDLKKANLLNTIEVKLA